MKVYVPYYNTEMEVKTEPISIFDSWNGGQGDADDNYFIIMSHKETKYAMTVENYFSFRDNKGRNLKEGETMCVNGEYSRGMTFDEERDYDMGIYDFTVDIWGNIKA